MVETTESDEPDNEAEEEHEAEEPSVARGRQPRYSDRITWRQHFAQLRDEKMQREFAEKPYRARGGRSK